MCIGLVMGKTKAMAWNNVEYVAAYKLMRGVWEVASAFRYCRTTATPTISGFATASRGSQHLNHNINFYASP